jgi:hypothetical protein
MNVSLAAAVNGPPYEIDLRRLRKPGAVLLAGGLVFAHLPSWIGLPCPLRALTGVPCPFCGLTISVRQLCGGHVTSALSAAPLGLVVVLLAVLAVLGVGPRAIRLPPAAYLAVLLGEWLFELVRFHVL